MNVLNKLTIKSLEMNKKRTLVTIVGIILSTALICAASGLVTSMQKTEIETVKKASGDYHTAFMGIKKENLKYIEENRYVKDYYCIEGLGYAELKGSKNLDKPYVYVMAFDQRGMESAGLKLIEGKMPQNDTEIVVTRAVKTNGGVSFQVGDIWALSIGKRESEGYELNQQNPYLSEEEGRERLTQEYQKDYTIVGIIERPHYTLEPYSSPGYSVITSMNEVQKQADIYVNFTNVQKVNQYALSIQGVLKKYQEWSQEPVYNRELLRWCGNMIGDGTRTLLFGVGGVVIVIIMISSVLVIRNSFAISVTERMKQYGMLASVGATSVQIRKNVLFEGIVLGVIGIPMGILSGILAVFILIQVVNYILRGYITEPIVYYLPFLPIVMAFVLSMVTIYVSAISSARKASKVSPMEAIRSNQDIKITAKKIKSFPIIKKCFGIGGEIAYKNLKRNQKKYRATVISMVVSIVLFLSMYSFIHYGFKYSGVYYYYSKLNYNLGIALNYSGDVKDEYQIYRNITNIQGMDSWSIIRHNSNYAISVDSYVSELGKKILKAQYNYETTENVNDEKGKEKKSYIYIISVGEKEYQKYIKSLGIKKQDKQGAVLIEAGYHFLDDKKMLGNFYNIKEGDIINVTMESDKDAEKIEGTENMPETGDCENQELSLKILKVTDHCPLGVNNRNQAKGFFVISDTMMDQIGYNAVDMRVQAKEPYDMEQRSDEELQKYLATGEKGNSQLLDYNIANLEEEARKENSIVLVMEIFIYGFITVITLIGVTNIFNTITTNMSLREREFAMLRSVGMTKLEFSGMIRIESIFYGAKALLIGIPIGTACSFLIFQIFDNHMDMKFVLPWKIYLVVILFVMLMVGLTMGYSFSKIKNKNIIEAIRKDTL